MNFTTYLLCFLAGLLGILFHIFAVKLPAIKQQAKVANMPFSYSAYFQDDLAAILGSLLTVVILLVVLDELVAFKPAVLPYLKAAFVFVGFTGSSILISLLGKAQDKINQVVDVKTDVADGKK
jgi:hypothetical protein